MDLLVRIAGTSELCCRRRDTDPPLARFTNIAPSRSRRQAAAASLVGVLLVLASGCAGAGSPQASLPQRALPAAVVAAVKTPAAPAVQPSAAPIAQQGDLRPPVKPASPSLSPNLSSEVKDCLSAELPRLKGTVIERSFNSPAMGKDMRYVVYLPPGYQAGGDGYPVLYMLHGRGGARTEWLSSGILAAVDRGIEAGKTVPMIVVVPEGQTGYWTDHADSGPKWGTYIVKDLVAHIDATYSTRRQASARAIGGESMGGWGALHHGLTRPDVFGIVGAHSPALRPDDGSLAFLGRGDIYASKDPMSLAKRASSHHPRIWIDTGVTDPWADRAAQLHKILSERSVDHSWQLNPGDHSWTYWKRHLDDYVNYYSRSFEEMAVS